MSLNSRDAKDAALGAWTDVQMATQEFMRQWNAPEAARMRAVLEQTILKEWDRIPPEGHEKLKEQDPKDYAKAERVIAEMRRKNEKPNTGSTGSTDTTITDNQFKGV